MQDTRLFTIKGHIINRGSRALTGQAMAQRQAHCHPGNIHVQTDHAISTHAKQEWVASCGWGDPMHDGLMAALRAKTPT